MGTVGDSKQWAQYAIVYVEMMKLCQKKHGAMKKMKQEQQTWGRMLFCCCILEVTQLHGAFTFEKMTLCALYAYPD